MLCACRHRVAELDYSNIDNRSQLCAVTRVHPVRGWSACKQAYREHIAVRLAPCCAATPPKLITPKRFRFCEICANGTGTVECTICHGTGTTVTKPGGAGTTFYIGEARCNICYGQGIVPCPLCAGYEDVMAPPDPDRPADDADDEPQQLSDDDDSWRRFGRVDIARAGHGW